MKIRRLELENFRQFYGRQELTFSTDPQKNVTLIYGSNGAGKTTLLNAFTWGLYGDTTPGLAESDWLISNLAWSEATQGEQVSARVRIEFEDQDRIYELERVQTARKGPEARVEMMVKDAATLHVTGSAGENERVEISKARSARSCHADFIASPSSTASATSITWRDPRRQLRSKMPSRPFSGLRSWSAQSRTSARPVRRS